jgi:outer membrane protein
MKKLFILSLVALTSLTVNAQRKKTKANTSQGNWALRLGAGFNSATSDPAGDALDKMTEIRFTPSIGYFVSDNLEIGANINLSKGTLSETTKVNPYTNDYTTSSRSGFGIFAQKYFPVNNWFAFYGNANVGMNFGNDNFKSTTTLFPITNTGASTSGYGGSLNMGFAFTPTNNVALMADLAGFGVMTETVDPDGANNSVTQSSYGLNVWRNPYNLSFVWFFGGGRND